MGEGVYFELAVFNSYVDVFFGLRAVGLLEWAWR